MSLLKQRDDVTHAENSTRHPVRMEQFQLVELLADTDKLNRDAGDFFDGKCRTAASVSIELGKNHTVELESIVENFGTVDRVLSGHRVANEQNLMRLHAPINLLQLVHQFVVDMQSTGGVEDNDVRSRFFRRRDTVLTNLQRSTVGRVFGVNRNADLFTDDSQLLDSGRTLKVGSDEKRLAAFSLQQLRELAARCGFSSPLQTTHHQDGGGAFDEVERVVNRAHQIDEFLIDDPDNLFGRAERLQNIVTDCSLGNTLNEVLGDVVIDVSFQQRLPHRLHTLTNARLSETTTIHERQRAF